MRAALLGVVLALVGLVPATAQRTTNDVTTGNWRPGPIAWQPCAQNPADASVRCGTVRVPIDWTTPNGPTMTVAIGEHLASGTSLGPLVINPGGPGASGVQYAVDEPNWLSAKLLSHFDVIGFDPRGVGGSSPVRCSATLLSNQPTPFPADQADYTRFVAGNKQLGEDCAAHTGAMFGHVDTWSVAHDIDAIRAALNVPQISYYGVSYGTLMGEDYAQLFPGRVRAMALDSVMDHSLGTAAFLNTEAAAAQDSFEQFTQWCQRNASCALHGQDVTALWDKLMSAADAGKLIDPSSGGPLSWWELAEGAEQSLPQPNWAQLAGEIAGLSKELSAPAAKKATNDGQLMPYPLAVFCADWSFPINSDSQLQRYFGENEALAPQLRTSATAWVAAAFCDGWPSTVTHGQQRLDVHTNLPVLVMNAVHDPQTPYDWALDVAGQLGANGRLVTYQGWGHRAYGRSDCTTGYVDNYLIGKTLPRFGAGCAAVEPSTGGAK
ncbi:MAG TPA: alpha/beta fold hydrolase [Pseudonocardiaceae bacterium]